MPRRTVFLDLDGVLVDQAMLGPEYVRLLGDVVAPLLGGAPAEWGAANAATFPSLFERLTAELGPETDPHEAYRFEYIENVRAMCLFLGKGVPDDAACERIGRAMNVYVRGHSRAVFPGAAAAVRGLAEHCDLHLATGNPSWNAEAQLRQMGVRELVGLPCGPDLVGVMKRSPAFYPALFDRAGVGGALPIVVDDSPAQLALAARAGARTVLVAPGGRGGAAEAVIETIADLADVLVKMA